LPPEAARQLGLLPNSPVQLIIGENEIRISRSIHQLARVLLWSLPTPATSPVLTCMRNVWEEDSGYMSEKTFARIWREMKADSSPHEFSSEVLASRCLTRLSSK
jgi:hypothetical protein